MSPAVQPLLLFLLCRDLFNYALVTAGSVLDTAIDTADGRRADLYLFHDLVIGAAAKQQLCRFQGDGLTATDQKASNSASTVSFFLEFFSVIAVSSAANAGTSDRKNHIMLSL
mgnify:CR=1 FL=1